MRNITIVLCLLWSVNLYSLEQSSQGITHEPIKKLIITNNDKTKSVFLIRIDLSNDQSNIEDIAHLTEHLLFKGTHENPQFNAFTTYLTNNNIKSNGATYTNYIDFYYIIDNKILESAIPRIVQQFTQPLFSPSQIEKELIPFQEETNNSRRKISYQIDSCLSSKKNKSIEHITSFSPQQISIKVTQWYKKIFLPQNISLMLWSSKPKKALNTLLNNTFSYYDFHNAILENDGAHYVKPNDNNKKVFCSITTTDQSSVFQLRFENKKFHTDIDIQVFLTLLSLNTSNGSLLSELKKHTNFDGITHVSIDNTEIIEFHSKTTYTLTDTLIAKKILFNYLRLLKNNKLPNEVNHSRTIHKLFPITQDYKYLTLQNKFSKGTKQWLNGEDLQQKLASMARFLLESEPTWIIDDRIKSQDIHNENFIEKALASLDINLLDLTSNKHFSDNRTEHYKEIEFLSYPVLSSINQNLAVQTFKQESDVNLTSLLINIKPTPTKLLKTIDFNKIKENFIQDNKHFLTTLKTDFIHVKLEADNGLSIRVSSYTPTFVDLINDVMNRLQRSINKATTHQMTAEFTLLGTVTKQILFEVSQHSKKYSSPISENKIIATPKYVCAPNCINFPLAFASRNKSIAFAKVLISLSNERLLSDIRFSQVISYNAEIALTFKKTIPELRIFASNNNIDINDYLSNFLMATNYNYLSNNKKKFNIAKRNLIINLRKITSYSNVVDYYWFEQVTYGLSIHKINDEIEEIENMSFAEFIMMYKKFITSHK